MLFRARGKWEMSDTDVYRNEMDTDFQPFDSASRPWQAPIPLRRFTLCRRMGKGGSSTAAVKKTSFSGTTTTSRMPRAARRS